MTQPWFRKAANSHGGCSTQSSESCWNPTEMDSTGLLHKNAQNDRSFAKQLLGILKKNVQANWTLFLWLVRSTCPCKAARLEQINMNGLILNHFIRLQYYWSVI